MPEERPSYPRSIVCMDDQFQRPIPCAETVEDIRAKLNSGDDWIVIEQVAGPGSTPENRHRAIRAYDVKECQEFVGTWAGPSK